MLHLSKRTSNRIFQLFFWISIGAGAALIVTVLLLGWPLYKGASPKEVPVDVGVMLATGALALFTAFLWLSAAITVRFARDEISISTAVSSANLTLQLDNRFNSDRALHIRHGAIIFLAEERGVDIKCRDDITPYRTDPSNLWYGLTSDLIDLFNYFDWIGYLTSEESNAIDEEVVRQKLGPWIINYYEMSRAKIDHVQEHHPERWRYLDRLYEDLIDKQKKWYTDNKEPLPAVDEDKELDAFLQREHVRSHRGFHPPPSGSHSRPSK
jgi:hypothetical protein